MPCNEKPVGSELAANSSARTPLNSERRESNSAVGESHFTFVESLLRLRETSSGALHYFLDTSLPKKLWPDLSKLC